MTQSETPCRRGLELGAAGGRVACPWESASQALSRLPGRGHASQAQLHWWLPFLSGVAMMAFSIPGCDGGAQHPHTDRSTSCPLFLSLSHREGERENWMRVLMPLARVLSPWKAAHLATHHLTLSFTHSQALPLEMLCSEPSLCLVS